MAVVTLTVLKAKYQTGDFPTEQDFIDLIDTLANDSIAVYKRYMEILYGQGVEQDNIMERLMDNYQQIKLLLCLIMVLQQHS